MPTTRHTALAAAALSLGLATPSLAEHASVIVFDASGSMWAQLEDGKSRIEIAREVIDGFAADRDPEASIGVVAYGHNRRGDCGDIETVLPIGQYSGEELSETIRALNPQGMTPLTDSMAMARDILPATAESADIILVTDGLENCGGDPCALAEEFAAEGIDLRAHVVGFALEEEAVQSLSCVPEQTGGELFITQTGAELTEALASVTEAEPSDVPVQLRALDARDPDEVVTWVNWQIVTAEGEEVFADDWRGILDTELMPGQYTVEAEADSFAGAADFEVTPQTDAPIDVMMAKTLATLMLRAEDAETGETLEGVTWTALDVATEAAEERLNEGGGYMPMHLEPGEYRLEAAKGELTGETTVTATREEDQDIVLALEAPARDIDVSLDAPAEVTAGADFEVTVTGADHRNDYMLIAPEGADEEVSRYNRMRNRVGGDGTHAYTAPSAPGSYELRYYLDEDRSLAARHAIEVSSADVTLEAPAEVTAGDSFEATIGGGISGHVVLVEADRAADDTVSRYERMRNSVDGDEGTVERTAPDAPGSYALRYHAADTGAVLAEVPVDVTAAEEEVAEPEAPEDTAAASLDAPDSAGAGSTVEVAWEGPAEGRDFIVVVEPGAPEGDRGHGRRASSSVSSDGEPVQVQMPDALGPHELRYVDHETDATLASREIELTPVEATVSAPAEVPAGAQFEVEWDGPVNRNDFIVIVEAGAPEGTSGHHRRASSRVSEDGAPVEIQAPDALGTYEVRYVVNDSDRVLASQEVTLAPVEASVSAPEEVPAGAQFEVEWDGPVNRNDFIVIVEAGAPEGTSGHHRRASSRVSEDGAPVEIQAPDALGNYEVRYVINDSDRVLASQELRLTPVEATLDAPDTVLPGADFEVDWEGPVNRNDFIAIVEPDAPEGDSGDGRSASSRVDDGPVTLTAPEDEGDYEIRYVINDSDRTLAAIPITVGGADVTLEVDGPVATGGVVEIAFTGPGRYEDLIEIVEAGASADDDALQDARASQGSPAQLFAPSSAGEYEIRYRASDSGEVLATVPLVVE